MNTFFSHEQKHWTMKIFLEKMAYVIWQVTWSFFPRIPFTKCVSIYQGWPNCMLGLTAFLGIRIKGVDVSDQDNAYWDFFLRFYR